MDAAEVLELLRKQVKEAGSISGYSRQSGVHPATVSNFLDFRYSNRELSDGERTALAIKSAEGKRLLYRCPSQTEAA